VRAALQDYRQLAASLSGLEETLYSTDKNVFSDSNVESASSQSADVPRQSPSRAYLLRAGSVILDNLLQLKLLMSATASAHIAENLEVDCAIEPLSAADTRAATKAVSSAVSAQQKLLAVLSEGGSLALGASTTWGPYELPRGSEEHIDRPISKTAQAQINKLADEVDAFLCKEAVVAERMVTADVMGPVLKSVRGLRDYLKSCTSHPLCLTEAQEKEQQPAVEQLDETGATLASSLVDSCLTAVQRLRAIAAPTFSPLGADTIPNADAVESTGASALDVDAVFTGMLGGSTKRDASSATNTSVAADVQTRDAGSLHQCLGFSMGATATLQSHHLSANLDALNAHFSALLLKQGKKGAASTSRAVLSTLPLVQRVASAQALLLSDLCAAYKSAGKFSYIVLRVFRVLLAKGLCSAESKEGEGDGGGDGAKMTFEDDVEGTGMGEGQGKTDVSDQIENEEQLAGLKDDKQDSAQNEERKPSEKLKQEDKDKGVEMSQNFEGDMFDLPQEEDQPEDKNEDEEDDEAEEDLERELGEADKDDIVDEKQWDSDEDGSTGEDGEGFEKDSKMQGDELEGETHTRADDKDDKPGEDKKDDEKKKNEKDKADADKAEPEGMEMDDKQEEGDINEDKGDEKEKPQGVDVRSMEEEEENDDNDKPAEDDQDRDEEGGDNGPNAEEQEAAEGGEDLPDDMNIGAEDGGDDENNADNDTDDMEMPEAEDQGSQAGSDDDGEGDENMEQDVDKDEEEEAQLPEQQNAVMSSGGGNDPDEQHKPEEDDSSSDEDSEDDKKEKDKTKLEKDDADEEHARPAAYGVNAGEDDDGEAVLGTEEAPDGPPPDQADSAGPKGQGSRSKGAGDSGDSTEAGGDDVHDGRKPPPSREREPPNPFKDKGDINKAWHRRLNIAVPQESEENEDDAAQDDAKKDQQPEKPADRNGKGLFEYGKDEEQGDQVLADVPEDQATQLPQGQEKQAETEGEEPAADEQERMQEDEPVEQPKKAPKENKRNRTGTAGEEERESESKKARSDDDNDNGSLDDAGEQDDDNEEGEEKTLAGAEAEKDQDREKQMRTNFTFRMGKSELADASDVEEELSLALQRATDDFGYVPEGMNRARDLWSRYRAATDTHSMRLCEQLRLVLEPTLATRLQGDYRTGKRINMRRVIGYVASGFRKDKIWLRRTKPAKREYQVMLMIDDSRSMGTAGPLALSALATISNALSKLEVGDLCVCAFAETVRQLHPFGQPFNEEAGARCVSQFLFEQDRTLLGASLSAVAPIFEEAAAGASRASGPSAVCLQICFIISDARLDTDNRARLDAVVRRMAEQNILVVLVILDKNDDPKDSIFNTKSIEFVNDKIVTKSYLDDFPFPYYIAIQRLDALPDVLADALKQWFELIGSQIGVDNA
jgi:midasin